MLDNFFYHPSMPPGDLHGTYNLMLVALSYAIASFSSFVALYIARNIRLEYRLNYWWLLGGALTLGVGIWTMHFIGMQAFIMSMPISYDPLLTLLSMLCAIAAAAIAFYITSGKQCNFSSIVLGGIVIGLGICSMHYLGMTAMLNMHILYIPSYFVVSVLIAITAAQVAMWLMVNIDRLPQNARSYARLFSALIMGAAICGMHYTGMASAMFYSDHLAMTISYNKISPELLSLILAFTTILIIGTGLILAIYQAKATDQQRSTEALLITVDDGIMQIRMNGIIESCNPAAEKIFGYDHDTLAGQNFYKLIKINIENEDSLDLDQFFNSGHKNLELVGCKKNGDHFPAEITISKLNVSQGDFFVIIIRDISTRKQSEEKLHILNQSLVDLARKAGMIEVTNSVLHTVSNVLNSINTSASVIYEKISKSEVTSLTEIAKLIDAHRNHMNDFLTNDEKGKKCLEFIILLAKVLPEEHGDVMEEVHLLTNKVEHVKYIIQMQQGLEGNNNLLEEVDISSLINDALSINGLNNTTKFSIETHCQNIPRLVLNKVKLVQILVNIIQNAKAAVTENGKDLKIISISAFIENNKLVIEIEDNGTGIDSTVIKKIFSFGFTTKKHGYGFGLHSSLNSAKEMEGTLKVESQGKGKGAKFRLEVPYQSTKSFAKTT